MKRTATIVMFAVSALVVVSAFGLSRTAPSLSSSLVSFAPVARASGELPGFNSFRLRTERNIRLWKGSYSDDVLLQEAQRGALEELVQEAIIRSLLKEYDAVIDPSAVDQEYIRMMLLAGGPDAFDADLEVYGWTEGEFKEEVVRPAVERVALQKVFYAELPEVVQEKEREAYVLAEEQRVVLLEGGTDSIDFDTLPSDVSFVELGWTEAQLIDPWFFKELYPSNVGTVTAPIRSPLGYHVILVEDERPSALERELYLSEVLVDVPDYFSAWLQSEFVKEDVTIYLPHLHWEQGGVVSQ